MTQEERYERAKKRVKALRNQAAALYACERREPHLYQADILLD